MTIHRVLSRISGVSDCHSAKGWGSASISFPRAEVHSSHDENVQRNSSQSSAIPFPPGLLSVRNNPAGFVSSQIIDCLFVACILKLTSMGWVLVLLKIGISRFPGSLDEESETATDIAYFGCHLQKQGRQLHRPAERLSQPKVTSIQHNIGSQMHVAPRAGRSSSTSALFARKTAYNLPNMPIHYTRRGIAVCSFVLFL